MRRASIALGTMGLLLGAATPALAQQALSFNVGYFGLRSEDSRTENDVLVENLDFLSFEIKDFNGLVVGGEYLVGLGDYFEAGVGAGFYQRTVPSVYLDFVEDDGSEIEQDLKLRVVPVTATLKWLPLGHTSPFQPYVGGGIGIFNWRYSESGEFVDFFDFSVFRDTFVADGTEVGPVVLAGVRGELGRQFLLGGEFRYQQATGSLEGDDLFLADEIDLGGYNLLGTFTFRF